MSDATLERFVSAFRRAIRGEMEAMRERLGPFEIALGEGELLPQRDDAVRYRFALATRSDKLMQGIECSLRSAGRETLVTVERLSADSIELRAVLGARHPAEEAARTQAGTTELAAGATLVVYPWFLYEKLDGALGGLSLRTFPIERALELFGHGQPRVAPRALMLEHGGLNASQRAAVQLCSDHSLAFVWGPPGTGKTRTLGHVVAELLAQGRRMLLVSTTNAAVDQALAQIASTPEGEVAIERGAIVRLGRSDADSRGASLREVMQRAHAGRAQALTSLRARHRRAGAQLLRLRRALERLDAHEPAAQTSLFAQPEPMPLRAADLEGVFAPGRSRGLCAAPSERLARVLSTRAARLERIVALCRLRIEAHEAALRSDEAAVVQRAGAVLTTLTGAYFNPLLEGLRFDSVIVEEASMAILPSLFYAACLARDQTIMVGDPRQLPPIVQSSDPRVVRAMGRSIFEVRVPEPHASPHVVMLDTQYRMHPRIGELVSRLFYAGRLQHGEGTRERETIAARAPYPGEPLVIVDTAGGARCASRPGSGSRRNDDSAELCVRLALEATAAGARSVAVITPYADQAREIRMRLRGAGGDDRIECSTVHRFQGHERDLVIFDTVDAAPMRPGVLLNDPRASSSAHNLINVSLSRARGKLIVVCDVSYFERSAPGGPIDATLAQMLAAHAPRVAWQAPA